MKRKLIAASLAVLAGSGILLCAGIPFAEPDRNGGHPGWGSLWRAGEAPQYQGGKSIEITYGRPIKRGHDL